jgi:hypothetical protein
MLRQAKEFKIFKLRARDGDIGKAKEFYFDDENWTVRYLVANTGGWLTYRLVLISPYALGPANEAEQVLPVDLTKKQIEESPSLNNDQPVSRQFETRYYSYYGWPSYWSGPHIWGESGYPDRQRGGLNRPGGMGIPPVKSTVLHGKDAEANRASVHREVVGDPHLRSTQDVTGHHIQALDGEIGHVEDFIIDDETWAIRYLVIDTKNWWAGKSVLISPQWIERVSWGELKVFVNLSREIIKESPEYTAKSLITRDYEIELHKHYDREGYWADELVASQPA